MVGLERFFGLGLSATLLATMVIGCAADAGDTNEEQGATSESIIGGKLATAYPEAALINGQGFYCSGSVIAPRIVLTAGHCAGSASFTVKAPFANNQSARGTRTWTDYVATGEVVNPNTLDVAVIILDTPITLSSYPKLGQTAVEDGTDVVNVGRIQDGHLSTTSLYFGAPVSVSDGAPQFPKAYLSTDIIQSGDSGGPVYTGSGASRKIVAVNSGAGGSTQVLARVDLAYAKIQQLIAANP